MIDPKRLKPGELTLSDGSTIKYTPQVAIVCIYCNKTVVAASFEDGNFGLIHDTPECAEFTAMDPAEFLKNNREKFEKDIDEGKTKPN